MQQSGGSGPAGAGAGAAQYGVPDVSQFVSGSGGRAPLLGISSHEQLQQQSRPGEIQSPISHRTVQPPTTQQQQQQNQNQNQNQQQQQLQLVPSGAFGEHDEAVLAAEDGERGGPVGNRWPRQETLALLKIRSDMDTAFRDASLKGPLWEEVSRKLAELGYQRSSKKCKEKFENVQKYYKRTKDGRAGRQDGKCYRFFSQLEALHNNSSSNNINNSSSNNMNTGTSSAAANNNSAMNPRTGASNALPMSSALPAARPLQISPPPILSGGISNNNASAMDLNPSAPDIKSSMFYRSSNLSSTSESSEEDYDGQTDSRKRKRGGSGGTAKKMMLFFEQLIKQVMERQETMQQKFLEAIEKREHDRMIREEAWKRQELARLTREQEVMAQERSLAASRDAAFIAFLQKVTGQSIQIPLVPPVAQSTTTVNTVPAMNDTREATTGAIQLHSHQQQHQHQPPQQQQHEIMNAEQTDLSSFDHGSSRWPKSEVHALIKLRSAMESRYQDAGPKGPLWEEISNGMTRLGYSRSSKRCKEKWENINKYFKKVKESNKKRPEDAKTCPYFHQLDQLYKKKQFGNASNAAAASNQSNKNQPQQQQQQQQQSLNQKEALVALPAPPANSNGGERADGGGGGEIPHEILAIMPPPVSENQNSNGGNKASPATATIPASNGGLQATAAASSYYPSPDNGDGSKKQPQSQQQQQPESVNINMMDVMVDMDAIQNEQEQQHQNHQHQHQQQPQLQPQPQPQQQQPQPPPSVEDYDSDKMDADDDEDEDDEDDDSDNTSADQEQSQQHHSHRPAIPAATNSHDHIPFAQFVHEPRNPAPTAAASAASTFMAMVHRMASSGAAAAGGPEAAEFKSSKT